MQGRALKCCSYIRGVHLLMTLYEIITGCQKNDERAHVLFLKRFLHTMVKHCRRMVRDPRDIMEIVNHGFLKAFRAIENNFIYQSDNQTEAWLRKIMTNLCLDHIEKEVKKKGKFTHEIPDSAQPGEIIPSMEYRDMLDFLHMVKKKYRMVFILFVVEGLTHEEIAEQLNITVNTSYSYLNRARKILQKFI